MNDLEGAIRAALVEGKLSCVQAFVVAAKQRVGPIQVGQEASRLGIRINRCQLGLFGYAEQGEKRIVKAEASVTESLKEAIQARLVEGRLPCLAAWEIAEKLELTKLGVANAAEGLNLRISDCQLGCFT